MRFSDAKKEMLAPSRVTSIVSTLVPAQRDDPRFSQQTYDLEAGFCPVCGLHVTMEYDPKVQKYFYTCENEYHFWVRNPDDLGREVASG